MMWILSGHAGITRVVLDDDTVNSRVSTIRTRQILADNRGWRIIERGEESRAITLRKSVPIVFMADNRELTVQVCGKSTSNVREASFLGET